MIENVEQSIRILREETLENVSSIVGSIDSKSSRKYVRTNVTKIYNLLENYSSFFLDENFYTSLRIVINSLYQKIEAQYYLPRLYQLSLITSSEEFLRTKIINSLDEGKLDWLDDEINVDFVCKLFATESKDFLSALRNVLENSEVFYGIAFRLSENRQEFLRNCRVNDVVSRELINSIICKEICRNPCRHDFLAQADYYSSFLDYLKNSNEGYAVKATILLHYYSTIDNTKFSNLLSIHLCESLLSMSRKEHRLLFLMIRRLPNKKVSSDFKGRLLSELAKELPSVTKLLIFKLLAGALDVEERTEIHLEFVKKSGIKNYAMLATAASVLELPQTSLSLLRGSISNQLVRDWIPKGSFETVKDIFYHANNALPHSVDSPDNLQTVSAILTTFNPDIELLHLAIESLQKQIGVNVQIIIVDDCSNKESLFELERLVSALNAVKKNIVLIKRETNEGQYSCRNVALKYAKGTFICIQDDDDISHPYRLLTQINALESKSGSMLCYTKHLRIKENLSPCIDDRRSLEIFGDGPATLLFRTSVVEDIGGFRTFRSRGDIEFRERAKGYYGEGAIAYIDEPMYMMRSSLKSVSSIYEYLYSDKLHYYRDIIDVNSVSKNIILPSEKIHG